MAPRPLDEAFEKSRQCFEALVGFMGSEEATVLSNGALEEHLASTGRALLRQLYQDHLDLRACQEVPLQEGPVDAAGRARPSVETDHHRLLETVFGQVVVNRIAYRAKKEANLHVADALLNLPVERHSHGIRRLAAIEASRGSFQAAQEAIERTTGHQVGKRQVEQLAQCAAVDFEAFYRVSPRHRSAAGDIVVLSADAKGIVMRPDALRPATAAAAATSTAKLTTRLSKGEKRNRKRMAEVASVYEVTPVPRTPTDILAGNGDEDHDSVAAPKAKNKWLTASVVDDAATVVTQLFDEAERRDKGHRRTWVALVDGNNHQIDRIEAESLQRKVDVTIVIDFIHVLEYLWGAAWSFFNEGDPAAERWVKDKATAVLEGKASTVAASITRKATCLGLDASDRKNADTCANYLLAKRDYLDYPTALERGWPIATGIIEGACRYLVKDRLDITGARWGLEGAEAVLKLRALRSNGDFESYWNMHLDKERQRVHESRYAGNLIPHAA
jgi:hypothetical protein